MPTHPSVAVTCYLISGLLDAFDGHAARYLNQGTKFGALLDMLTDRCATMCLCVVLAMFYPKWAIVFQLSMSLDIASHWLHMLSSMMKGSSSHKTIDLSGNPILRLYYTSRVINFKQNKYFSSNFQKFFINLIKPVLFFMCAGNELFFSMLYLLNFFEGPLGKKILFDLFFLNVLIHFNYYLFSAWFNWLVQVDFIYINTDCIGKGSYQRYTFGNSFSKRG